MDSLIRTAKEEERELTEEEAASYTELRGRFEELETEIGEATEAADREKLLSDHAAMHARSRGPYFIDATKPAPAAATRSLDEILWAQAERVPAGTFTRSGMFIPNPYGAVNPVPKVMVRNIEEQLVESPGIEEFRPEHRGVIRAFQRTVADMVLFGMLTSGSGKMDSAEAFERAKSYAPLMGRFEASLRALDVDTATKGTEWVPTGIGADIHELVRAAGKVAPLFASIEMPTNPWKMPLEGADTTAYRVAEPASDTASKVTAGTPLTGAVTFDAEIFGARTLWSRSVEADSAAAILGYARSKIVIAFTNAIESAVINGDADGTHMDTDTDTAGATSAEWAWDGLRKRGLANTKKDGSGGAATAALVRATRAMMAKWGLNPAELAIITPIGPYYDILDEDDFRTLDKYGAQATILNGELGRFDGIPVVVSEHGREDLNASGVNDGVTEDFSHISIVNRGQWAFGSRMPLDLEVDDSIYREAFQRVIVGFQRMDFQNLGGSTDEDTGILYNIT
jgi:hypothetical protein